MKRALVDTSAWIAYARRDDPDHEAVRQALEQWQGRLVTSNFILDETVTFLRARTGHPVAVKVGEALQDASAVDLVRLNPEDEKDAWAWFKGHKDKAYSYTDCTTFALMRRLRIRVAVTTDRHFRQAGFEVAPAAA